jgi:hypothetical protein
MTSAMSEIERYKALVYWCRESIQSNKDFLYDVTLFHNALHMASSDFGYPYEVRYLSIVTQAFGTHFNSHRLSLTKSNSQSAHSLGTCM